MTDIRKKSSCNSSAGFTLVEILLVLVIIGILAGVVVVNFGGRSTKAMINATRSSIKAVSMAIEMYEVETGKYPSSLQDLTVSIDDQPPYIKGGMAALQDSWGNPFVLDNAGSSKFVIRSGGPDGTTGSEDDITSFASN